MFTVPTKSTRFSDYESDELWDFDAELPGSEAGADVELVSEPVSIVLLLAESLSVTDTVVSAAAESELLL